MQFLAVRSDRPVPPELQDKYMHKLDVEWYKGNRITYQLDGSGGSTSASSRRVAHLPNVCPDHPDWFLTPDRPD